MLLWEIRRAKNAPRPYQDALPVDGLRTGRGARPLRLLFLGDSLAAGLGADVPDGTLPVQVADRVGSEADIRVLAVPGSKVADVNDVQLAQLDALVHSGWVPDLVVLSAGANDVSGLTSRRRFVAGYAKLLDALDRYPTVVLSIPDIGMADRLAPPLRQVAATRAWQLDRYLRMVIEGRDNVVRADVRSLPEGMGRRAARSLLCSDRFHPGAAGYQVWAERIAAAFTERFPHLAT